MLPAKLNFSSLGCRQSATDINNTTNNYLDNTPANVKNNTKILARTTTKVVNKLPDDWENQISCALKNNNFDRIKELINQGINIKNISEKPYYHENSILTAPIHYGRVDLVKLYLEKGVNPNINCGDESTPLFYTLDEWAHNKLNNNDIKTIISLLIQYGSEVNMYAGTYTSALVASIKIKNYDVALLLVNNGAKLNEILSGKEASIEMLFAIELLDCCEGKAFLLELLLRGGKLPKWFNYDSYLGFNPLVKPLESKCYKILWDYGMKTHQQIDDSPLPPIMKTYMKKIKMFSS